LKEEAEKREKKATGECFTGCSALASRAKPKKQLSLELEARAGDWCAPSGPW